VKIRRLAASIVALVLVPGCDKVPEAAPDQTFAPVAAPAVKADPSACPPPEHAYDETEMGPRTEPLVVPQDIAAIAATDNTNLAVTTLAGGQICKDVSWLYNFGASARTYLDGRFVMLEWGAFEAFGTMLFDRSGSGEQVETGNPPAFSPSNARVAALQFTQSGFGGLENLIIWQVEPAGLKQLFALPEHTYLSWVEQGYDDFQIDRWQGENCLLIFGFSEDDLRAADWDRGKSKRTPFHAAETDQWDIKRGGCP
jgi:hypothetical protein